MAKMRNLLAFFVISLLGTGPAAANPREYERPRRPILVEAESFQDLGGWVVDQQFMDQMGSPMLLAHGMGTPVEDATTMVEGFRPGVYRVWVRTRDWATPWYRSETNPDKIDPPGKFQLMINGQPLTTTLGTQGAAWHWHNGGTFRITGDKTRLTLHDLTGFDGRCDAILFVSDQDFTPPDNGKDLANLRRELLELPDEPEDAGTFDLVVVGGGMAGTCAAVSAARLGLEVALIQDRPVLGGNNSSEVRVHLGGEIHQEPYPALGGIVNELDSGYHGNAQPPEQYDDEKKLAVVRAEKNLHLFLNTHVFQVEKAAKRIAAVIGKNIRTNREYRFAAPLFADCTGDATVGYLAGADYRYGRESRDMTGESLAPLKADRQTMGTSVMWYSIETEESTAFPDCPWAIQFNENNYQQAISGNWNWETGFRKDQIKQFERVRDNGLRAVYGNWAFQKNHAPDKARYAKRELGWVAHIGGKRESRRLLGDVILKQQDVDEKRQWPDACVTSTWKIDLHYPILSDQFPNEEFRSKALFHDKEPYAIPYRCLYSRNVENLFMAGRHVSVTHVALGTVRVMRTTGMMGEVVGMAAAVIHGNNRAVTPRDVYEKHLDELKVIMRHGVGKLPSPRKSAPPEWIDVAGPNLALRATPHVTSEHESGLYPPKNINDGQVSLTNNALRWVSGPGTPDVVELAWDKPQTFNAVRLVTGQAGASRPKTPITNFSLEYHDGTEFQLIPQAKIVGNRACEWSVKFDEVTTRRLRLVVTATPGNLTRIWEWAVYCLPAGE